MFLDTTSVLLFNTNKKIYFQQIIKFQVTHKVVCKLEHIYRRCSEFDILAVVTGRDFVCLCQSQQGRKKTPRETPGIGYFCGLTN